VRLREFINVGGSSKSPIRSDLLDVYNAIHYIQQEAGAYLGDILKFMSLVLDAIKHEKHGMYHNMLYNTINRLK